MDGQMENLMVNTKITYPRDGWHKNNLPKGWTEGELYGRHRKASPKGWTVYHKNKSPNGWMN